MNDHLSVTRMFQKVYTKNGVGSWWPLKSFLTFIFCDLQMNFTIQLAYNIELPVFFNLNYPEMRIEWDPLIIEHWISDKYWLSQWDWGMVFFIFFFFLFQRRIWRHTLIHGGAKWKFAVDWDLELKIQELSFAYRIVSFWIL